MSYIKEMWAVIAAAAMAWLSRIDNNTLNIIVNLLTITVILIGLIDWAVRRIRNTAKNRKPRRPVIDIVESTQKPFKTVNMLENPMETSEKIGSFVDRISREFKGGAKMKKFFKWAWYNKEQLFSIAYSIALLALSQMAIWTDLVASLLPALSPVAVIIVKIAVCVISLAFTALTVRNVCVTYGLSSLDTIDRVLAERAEAETRKLTPEQKKTLKAYISTLQNTLNQTRAELTEAEKALAEVTALYNADNTLVANYSQRKSELTAKVARCNAVIANVESKIADYKAKLDGKNVTPKA